MRKFIYSILSLFIVSSLVWAATTYTTNYSLSKPGINDEDWGAAVNTNFDTIDTRMKANADADSDDVEDGDFTSNGFMQRSGSGSYTTVSEIDSSDINWDDLVDVVQSEMVNWDDLNDVITDEAINWTDVPYISSEIRTISSDATPDTAGEVKHDSTVSGLSGGALTYYNGSNSRFLVDLQTAPSNDNYVVAYDSTADKFYMKVDADTGGSGVSDGDKGDITVTDSGTVWNYDADSIQSADINWDDLNDVVTDTAINWDSVPYIAKEIRTVSSDATPDTTGEIKHDSTVTGLTGGAMAYYNGTTSRYLVDLQTLPSTDDYVVSYDATADKFYMKADTDTDTDTNTNASTICSGTTTYLDGEGGCDDISSVYEAADANIIKSGEIDTFSELDAIVADKALVNKADGAVWLGAHDFGGATSFEVPNSDAAPSVAGQIRLDTTVTGLSGGAVSYYSNEVRYLVDLQTLPSTDDYVVAYDSTADKFYMKEDTGGAGATDYISEGDTKVETTDAGDGYVTLTEDGTAVVYLSEAGLGVGVTSPTTLKNYKLNVSTGNTYNYSGFYTYDDGITYTFLDLIKSDNDTVGTLAQTDSDDMLGTLRFRGVDAGGVVDNGAIIRVKQNGVADTTVPSDMFFETYTNSTTNSNQLVLKTDGNVGIGTSAPTSKFQVVGTLGIPSGDVSPASAGQIQHDSTVTGLTNGAVAYHNGTTLRYLVDLQTLPSTDDYVVAYDATADKFYMKADSTGAGGTLTADDIDASAELLAIMDDETGSGTGSPLLVFNQAPAIAGATLTGTIDAGGAVLEIPNSDASPSAVGQIRDDTTVTGLSGGALAYHNGTSVRYVVDLETLPSDDEYVIRYDATADKFYMGADVDTNTTYVSSDFTHDDLTGFVANEHIDWTSDQGATNIHSGNYTDTNTTYTGGDHLTLTGTDFDVDDDFLLNDGDTGTGAYDFGGADSFEIPNSDAAPSVAGQIRLDTTVTGLSGGAMSYYSNEVRYLVDLQTLPSDDDYVVAYDSTADKFYMKADANSGSATAWDDIGNPDADNEIDFGTYVSEMNVADLRIGDGGSNYVKVSGAGAVTFAGTGELDLPTATDPNVDTEGQITWDSDDDSLRGYDGTNQVVIGAKGRQLDFTLVAPGSIEGNDKIMLWKNMTGFIFKITSLWADSDTDSVGGKLFTVGGSATAINWDDLNEIEPINISTDNVNDINWYSFANTADINWTDISPYDTIGINWTDGEPNEAHITIGGWLDADVD